MSKSQTILSNIQQGIDKVLNKEQQVVFYVQDTKGTPSASVATMYQHAKTLMDLGFKAVILHERKDYTTVDAWLGEEYNQLPHHSVEENTLKIGPADFLIVPEIYGNVIEQVEQLPMEKIVLVQQFEHMLDNYSVGKSWYTHGCYQTITTSESLKNLIQETLRVKNVSVIPQGIEDFFTPSTTPRIPVIAIHCRDKKKAGKIIKQFYLKYPLLKFISFKDMHNMTHKDFAVQLKECALAVWHDENSSFGTFPLEAMKCNVPVIGKAPNIIPEWMSDENGLWVYDENQMVDMIFNYMKNWLEDTLPESYKTVSTLVDGKYTMTQMRSAVAEVYGSYFQARVTKLEKMKEKVNQDSHQIDEEASQPITAD